MSTRTLNPEQLAHLLETRPYSIEDELASVEFSYLRAQLFSHSNEMKRLFSERCCQPGEVLFEESDPGNYIYVIVTGRVAILKGSLESPSVLAYRGAWQIVGEMALLDRGARSATVVAVEPTRLLCTDWDGFRNLLGEQSFVGLNMLETLSQRLRQADEARRAIMVKEQTLSSQVSELESEKNHLLELARVRQETTDLIVHDLRNPLGAVYMALRTLEFSLSDQDLANNRELLDAALSACARMQRLVESILDVARMESGEAVLVLTRFDLRPLVEELANNTRTLLKDRVHLQTEIPDSLPTLVADRDKIERVIANLLDNAIKHTPSGGQITLAAGLNGDHSLHFSVTDNGPGIPPAERLRIFERFSQVSGEKLKRRGFGLGLTYCRLAVEAHHGQIWVEDGPDGKGSRFIFTLPIP